MRKLVRSFLDWLDKRFPEKVIVTQSEMTAMRTQFEALSKMLIDERLKKVETQINNLNIAVGVGALGGATSGVGSARGVFHR